MHREGADRPVLVRKCVSCAWSEGEGRTQRGPGQPSGRSQCVSASLGGGNAAEEGFARAG